MKILFDFACGSFYDESRSYRTKTLFDIILYLKKKGHKICVRALGTIIRPQCHKHKIPLYTRSIKIDRETDLYFCFDIPKQGSKKYSYFKKRDVPIITYESGWLKGSTIIDTGLFGDSQYIDTIGDLIEKDFNRKEAEMYRIHLLENNISKRQQIDEDVIPEHIKGRYIFIPCQKIEDVSVTKYSDVGMLEFIERTLKYAKKRNIPVILKQHPAVGERDWSRVRKVVESAGYGMFVNRSIYHLMEHALFTACVNSGSVIDNIVSRTPVYCCGKVFFYKSGVLLYDPDLERGLDRMIKKDYDWNKMKDKQLKMLWWLRNNLLFHDLPVEENMKRLIKHSGIEF